MEKVYTYLALGDSYTIGESVLLQHSFPYQAVQLLRQKGLPFSAPEIMAKTGWTTDELSHGIAGYDFLKQYHFVTLLIGVNNQYRGRAVEGYKVEFETLLRKAIQMAGGKKEHAIVLSIPDYSTTPFATSLDREKIAAEIRLFNSVNKAVSLQYKVPYIDITSVEFEETLVAADGLHPSEKAYHQWAEKVAAVIYAQVK